MFLCDTPYRDTNMPSYTVIPHTGSIHDVQIVMTLNSVNIADVDLEFSRQLGILSLTTRVLCGGAPSTITRRLN